MRRMARPSMPKCLRAQPSQNLLPAREWGFKSLQGHQANQAASSNDLGAGTVEKICRRHIGGAARSRCVRQEFVSCTALSPLGSSLALSMQHLRHRRCVLSQVPGGAMGRANPLRKSPLGLTPPGKSAGLAVAGFRGVVMVLMSAIAPKRAALACA